MQNQTPGAVARRLYEITAAGTLDGLEEVLAQDVMDHGVGAEEGTPGIANVRTSLELFRSAFPDLQLVVDDLFEAGDRAVTRWTVRGTHNGTFQGIPATGRTIRLTGIDILRVADGRVVERWASSDELGLLQQLVDRREGNRRSPREDAASAERRRADRRRQAAAQA